MNLIINSNTIILFDLDGTLIDTDKANFLAYKSAIFKITNIKIDDIYKERINRTLIKEILIGTSDELLSEIVLAKEKIYSEYLSYTKLIAENYKLLLKHSNTNKIYLVTNCRKNRALQLLDYHNIRNYFTDFIFRDENTESKYINKFETAIRRLDLNKKDILIYENENVEIEKAIKIGIKQNQIIKT
ncbi:HAD family hydrolase [Chryseobacterium camelliae]|uniref:HAD family hydrolase n=1 Tax=Chryseobacterium camelliae TaxID=1265445 RepID=UPI00286150AC|nr:HAD hydrolase-like protein [Chryseobacterium camelliae]MDR6513807.1 FMN phosphatase YigB (HAD superfamily) [Chryseobacterium camelliae]